jgi:flagellar hook-associated protein 2
MSLSTNLIAGLSSGFDWRGMIDQLIAIEHRRVDTVAGQKTEYQSKLSAFQSVNTMLLSLKTQSVTLAKSDSFNVYTSSLTTNSANYTASDFMSITTSTDAAPGSHTIEMTSSSSIAQARKISSKSFSSYDEALSLAGEFIINGRAVRVDDTDDLMDIRDKINNVNSGSNATGVTASILTVSDTDYRLVLTSDNTGEDAFNIFDASADTVNILQNTSTGLGFLDSTTPTIKNTTSDGAESGRFSSSDVAVGSMLGLTSAQTGTGITIGGGTVTIDLAADSLATIAGKIDAVGGVSASVESVTEDGTTSYYIDISGTTSFTDVNNVLQTLGILVGGQSDVAEVHAQESAVNTDGDATTAIQGTTSLANIWSNGSASGVLDGDTISIQGTRGDGTRIGTADNNYTITFEVGAAADGTDINALLAKINNSTDGFGTGQTATASISNGKIQIEDGTAGDSQLSLSLIANNNVSGGTLDFGTIIASTEGYDMQIDGGQDASVKIDGTTITSSTNIITDVIAGITINLKKIEAGSQVDLNISRDTNSIKSSVQGFIDEYNKILEYVNNQFAWDEETKSSGLLSGDGTLSSIRSSLQNIVISTIKGLPTDMNALSLIGINSDSSGILSINTTDFTNALVNDFNGVGRIFAAEGTTTDGDIKYISHTRETVAGDYTVKITTAAEQAAITGEMDLSGGIASDETIVITQGDRTATIALDDTGNGKSIDDIVNAINSELDTVYTELWTGTKANTKVGGGAITSSTLWKDIDTEGGSNLVTNDDTISFSGKTRSGTSVSGTYTINDKTTDTVQGLLSAIENAYGSDVSANINADGKLIVTDNTAGGSKLEISVTCNKEGGGSLDFGTMEVTTEGRYAMAVTASKDAGNQLVLKSDDYGSSTSFTIDVSGSELGLTDGTHSGVDVEGTINNEAATGSGQVLTGDEPAEGETTSVEGLSIKVTLTLAQLASQGEDQGNVKITMGAAEQFDRALYDITNEADGYFDYRLESMADRIDDFEDQIDEMEARLDRKMEMMINRFVAMELALSRLQNQSDWLAGQLNSAWSAWG